MMHNELKNVYNKGTSTLIGSQIYRSTEDTFINQAKYCKELLRRFDMEK